MSFRIPTGTRPRLLIPVVAVLVILVVAVLVGSGIYTDLLWFRQLGFSKVFSTILQTKILLFFVGGLLMSITIGANLVIAYRARPLSHPLSLEQQSLERYRTIIEPFHGRLLAAVMTLFGLISGISVAASWRTWQLWLHGQSFGIKDPQFHKDISFYMFTYPFLRLILGFAFTALVLATLASAAAHYLFGGIRLQTPGEKVLAPTRAHLSVLLGLLVLAKAIAYFLDRYGLMFSGRGIVTGASYTDVHASLPAKTILVVVALICSGLFFANAFRRNWTLPAVSFGLMVFSAVIVGGAYPALIQQFQVKPNEVVKESPYIARNIAATTQAFGLDSTQVTPYAAKTTATSAQLRADAGTISNARLLDPNKLGPTFEQVQQIRNYFGFAPTLDIDRYTINGKVGEYVVAARELDQRGLSADQHNWINTHLIYTHGVGFVAAPTNTVDPLTGRPAFIEANVPQTGPLQFTVAPRIYFGEMSPTYSIVDTKQQEIDGPSNPTDSGQATNTYNGSGGVAINSTLRRLMFAIKFREKNLLLSSALTSNSKIMFVRSPRDRVAKVAPYLTVDGDPYPAVVDGRVTWIVDGYTTSNGYPYAQRKTLGDVTADTTTANANGNQVAASGEVNYIRNSVKATVDAYDGTVTLYAFDEKDPVLRTWMKIFPGTVRPRAELDAKTDLVSHLRYPEDLFKVQRDLLGSYHVTDPRAFYSKEDFWQVPTDPNAGAGLTSAQPPYYLLAQVPGRSSAEFRLTTVMVARRRPNLAAFISVSSDPGDYGVLRVLRLPSDTTINGPTQASNQFESDPVVSKELTLLRGGGSQTINGNLLTLPVGGGLLYVQPVYVQASSPSSFPTLQRVIVAFGDRVGFAPTFAQALDQVFGASSPVVAPTGGPPATGTPIVSATLRQALADAQAAYDAGVAALARGDFAAYGKDQADLKAALDRAAVEAAKSAPKK